MKQPIKEIQAFINYDESVINDTDDLISFKISCDSGLCKTAMRKLEAKYLGKHNLLGKWVRVGFGVRLPDGNFDLIDYGSFLVTELTETKDTDTTSIVAYDKMVNAMTPYVKLDVEYPLRLIDYTRILCEACNLELQNDIFGKNRVPSFDSGQWEFNNGAFINNDGNLEFPNLSSTAKVRFNWDKKDKIVYTQFILVSGGNYRYNLTYYDESGNALSSNGNAEKDKVDNYLSTVKFGGDNEYGVAIQNAKYIELMFGRSAEYTPQPYIIKNIMVDNYLTSNKSAYEPYNTMNDWQITATKDADGNFIDLWENIDGITYRDIFQQIAQATGSTCIIHDDKVYFKSLSNTGEELTYNNMFKLKLESLYGEINSVVIGRDPIVGEDVFKKDDNSIAENGLTEYRISNNEIIDKDRENAITPIYDALYGISYYPFEATTEGLGWYEIGDNINIVTDTREVFKTSLFNYTITIDGSVKETLKTTAENKTQSQYQYANTVSKQIKNTEIIVNKQEQYIQSLVRDMYDVDGVVNENFTKIEQDIKNINFNVQNSGGANLIKNSVMFAYDKEDKPYNWEVEGDGTLTRISDVAFQTSGGISCHGFMLSNKTVRTEKIPVKPFDENDAIYYSFSTRIKKGIAGSCYVKIYNPDVNEEHIIPLEVNTASALAEHELTALKPLGEYYIIEFYGSADSNVVFTDNMFAIGEHKTKWTQANGEVMNTQVNFSSNGLMIRNINEDGENTGDYTVISPMEFAGYSKIDTGEAKKVFTLNRGVTEVNKLESKNEIAMPPLKIVPVTSGEIQGWAFVIA